MFSARSRVGGGSARTDGCVPLCLWLGSGSKAQTDAVEVEGGGQLGVGFGQMGEEKAVVIDVKIEGQAGALEGQTEELQMGQKRFPFIEADNDTRGCDRQSN